jgi:cell division protein FtsB
VGGRSIPGEAYGRLESDASMNRLAKILLPGLLVVAVYYAVFGGEYSMFELHGTRVALESESVTLGELESQIDSLVAWSDSLRNDPHTLERVAREKFGMIREGETLYKFAEPESEAIADTDEEG